MQQGLFDLLLAGKRGQGRGNFLQEGRLGWDKLFNRSRGLSWQLQLQLNCGEMTGWGKKSSGQGVYKPTLLSQLSC